MTMKNIDRFNKGRAVPIKMSSKWKPVINNYRLCKYKKDGIFLSQRDVVDLALFNSNIKEKTNQLLRELRRKPI